MPRPFFTIGHSTHPLDEFIGLLRSQRVTLVADVRKMPGSRRNPQYSAPAFEQALQVFQIGYRHIAELGGLRKKSRDIDVEVNGFWTNRSFHNYADYAESAEFRSGLAALLDLGHEATCAVMCAEAPWWRCHRRIIADYLIAAGETVFHIMGPGRVEPARPTEGARLGADGGLRYPPPAVDGDAG